MSYPRDLDDYSDEELQNELARREAARKKGLCDYCCKSLDTVPVCRYPKRHLHVRRASGIYIYEAHDGAFQDDAGWPPAAPAQAPDEGSTR